MSTHGSPPHPAGRFTARPGHGQPDHLRDGRGGTPWIGLSWEEYCSAGGGTGGDGCPTASSVGSGPSCQRCSGRDGTPGTCTVDVNRTLLSVVEYFGEGGGAPGLPMPKSRGNASLTGCGYRVPDRLHFLVRPGRWTGGTRQGELPSLPPCLPDQLPQSRAPNECRAAGRTGSLWADNRDGVRAQHGCSRRAAARDTIGRGHARLRGIVGASIQPRARAASSPTARWSSLVLFIGCRSSPATAAPSASVCLSVGWRQRGGGAEFASSAKRKWKLEGYIR